MTTSETHTQTHRAIEATFRIERARLIAGLARVVRNVDLAEELAQDALVVALAEWPRAGVPANPGAWLMAVAKRRAIDALRRNKMRERKHEEIARTLDEVSDDAAAAIINTHVAACAAAMVWLLIENFMVGKPTPTGTDWPSFPHVPIPLSSFRSCPTIETLVRISGPLPINVAPFTGFVICPSSMR